VDVAVGGALRGDRSVRQFVWPIIYLGGFGGVVLGIVWRSRSVS
jgi:hypothetical protein